jgi:hypothetical protein
LFLVFIAVSAVDYFNLADTFFKWLGWTVFLFLFLAVRDVLIAEEVPNVLSFKGAIYLAPFFFLGMGMQRHHEFLRNRILAFVMGIILVVGLMIQQLSWYDVIDYNFSTRSGIGLSMGVAGTSLLFLAKWNIGWLIILGQYSYTIYLFHAFGTAAGRILIKMAGIEDVVYVFYASLLLGLSAPFIAEKLIDPIQGIRMIFLGRPFSHPMTVRKAPAIAPLNEAKAVDLP